MEGVPAFAGAILAQLEAAGIVLLVLAGGIGAHLALGASQLNDRTSVYFGQDGLLDD